LEIAIDIIQLVLFLSVLILLSIPLGNYLAKVFNGENKVFFKPLAKLENIIYKLLGVNSSDEMDWKQYFSSLMIFNCGGLLFLLGIQIFQGVLPLNPNKIPNVEFFLALNTSISFVTNTNWQSYAGETIMSNFTQMVGFTVQNFLSAATGIAVLLALIRGIARRKGISLGNFWVDVVRIILYLLLPSSIILALVLVSQGVVQTLSGNITAITLEGFKQILPLGPAASQIAIKQLGTNGGGFFNTNSAFPFENPNYLTNFLEVLSILLIPSALVFMYGKMLNSVKHARIIFSVMLIIFLFGLCTSYISEISSNSVFGSASLMEGKETRFGIFNSVLWSTATTVASNGSVNAMISSMSPIAGLVSMINIQLGEIVFGGVGSGLYGMFLFILLTVFISGLMIGRTPEYLGKKIEAYEIKWTIIAVLIPNIVILFFSSLGVSTQQGVSSILNKGPHGLSEVIYAFSSAAGNNGSAFAGLNANTPFYNICMGLAMLAGRFGVIFPVLAIAGNLVKKNITPVSEGTFTTDNSLFAFLLISIILIVGALTFFPALAIGPFIEHLLMNLGIPF
jgi:potassium-transporting ATPase potassium-binding subunit